jgi:DNA-binding beta-propeller fold protein YncE
MDILLVLVQNAGENVSKEKLQSEVWGGEIGESTLPTHIRNLRKKLGTDENGDELIKAESGKGYRLAAIVTREPRPVPPSVIVESPHSQNPQAGLVGQSARPRTIPSRNARILSAIAAAVLLAVMLLHRRPIPAPPPAIGRIFVRATSEGSQPGRASLSHVPSSLAISPRGDEVFAVQEYGRTLSILSTKNGSVRTLALPQDANSLLVSPDGKLYIESSDDGVMVVNVDAGRFLPTIKPGGRVMGMAITPDGRTLFLAMSTKGLRQFSIGSGEVVQISDQVCPERVEADRQGRRLYVAYQCGGPTGSRGHDSVEIFDLEKGASLGFVSGPPMVGGQPAVSPDGKLVLLDGRDACWSPQYNHDGCKSAPSGVFHLLDSLNRQILHSFEFSPSSRSARFVDNSRFVLLGDSVSVIDAAKYSVPEHWNNAEDCGPTGIVLSPDGGTAYLGCAQNKTIRFFKTDGAGCTPPQEGLAMSYAADGTTADSAGVAELTAHGNLQFAPGRIGQAFFLDGGSYLSTSLSGYYEFGFRNSSLALYVKFAGSEGEMTLADWTAENPLRGIRLLKSAGNRFIFQSWPGGSPLESRTVVEPDTWYHVVVTKTGQDVTLYVNGKPESRGAPPPPIELSRFEQLPLLLGARSPGQPSFHGWLDEIAFYSRALTPKEVEEMYQSRESGKCKL